MTFPFGFAEHMAMRQDMADYAAKQDPTEEDWLRIEGQLGMLLDDEPARDQPIHRLLGVRLAEQCACVLLRDTGEVLTPCTSHLRNR